MANLFQISQDLEAIFNEIEDNGGEITPELEAQLALTEDNFKDKIGNYVKAINRLNNDITECKNEVARIKNFSESKNKHKERLNKILIDAVDHFGSINAKGIKCIDLQTTKLQLRNSAACELNDTLIQTIVNTIIKYLTWLYDTNQLGVVEMTMEDIVEYVNKTIIESEETSYLLLSHKDDDGKSVYRNITAYDIENIKVNFSTDVALTDLFKVKAANLVMGHIDYDYKSTHNFIPDKTSIKAVINGGTPLVIAENKTNVSLNIK